MLFLLFFACTPADYEKNGLILYLVVYFRSYDYLSPGYIIANKKVLPLMLLTYSGNILIFFKKLIFPNFFKFFAMGVPKNIFFQLETSRPDNTY